MAIIEPINNSLVSLNHLLDIIALYDWGSRCQGTSSLPIC